MVPNDRRNRTGTTSVERFVTGYSVSVSNDGTHFGASLPLYVLDSECQDTVNINGNLGFILKVCYTF